MSGRAVENEGVRAYAAPHHVLHEVCGVTGRHPEEARQVLLLGPLLPLLPLQGPSCPYQFGQVTISGGRLISQVTITGVCPVWSGHIRQTLVG
jgi:hypothetical protein